MEWVKINVFLVICGFAQQTQCDISTIVCDSTIILVKT